QRLRRFASLGHSIDKPALIQQRTVKRRGKRHGRAILDSPPGSNHTTHANLDQFPGDSRRELRAIQFGLAEQLVWVARRQMATVHEDQLRYGAHGGDLGRPKERAIGEHHATWVSIRPGW